mmetsp:Transcript_12139/g.19825  ORF Transcript_12139/g.19825 Transcript_12139/m.19825 type:complete len:458 (+) Transcript_12139:149-1522(+)
MSSLSSSLRAMLEAIWGFLTTPITSVLGIIKAVAIRIGRTTFIAIAGLIGLFLVSVLTFFSSTLIYAAVYNLYIPVAVHELPAYFDYAQGLNSASFPKRPQPPTALVKLLEKDRQWAHHGSRLNLTRSMYSESPFLLITDVEYDFRLLLHVAITKRNLEIGSFMAKMEILADHQQVSELIDPRSLTETQVDKCREGEGEFQTCLTEETRSNEIAISSDLRYTDISRRKFDTIASSSRPVTIPFRLISSSLNGWWGAPSSWFFSLFQLLSPSSSSSFGVVDDSVTLSVPLIEKFREHPYIRSAIVRVVLSDTVQVTKASIHIKTQLKGLRYMMYHWSMITALAGISILFLIQTAALVGAIYALWLQCGRPDYFPEFEDDSPSYGGAQRVPIRRLPTDDGDGDDLFYDGEEKEDIGNDDVIAEAAEDAASMTEEKLPKTANGGLAQGEPASEHKIRESF